MESGLCFGHAFASYEQVLCVQSFVTISMKRLTESFNMLMAPHATFLVQSYGGFCAVTYLSFAPQGLKQVLLTGGTPPLGNGCSADSVYRVAFEQVIRQNEKYYKRFPQDVEIVREIVKHLAESEGGGVRDYQTGFCIFCNAEILAKCLQLFCLPPSSLYRFFSHLGVY